MNSTVNILYLEDNPRDAELVRDKLQQTGMVFEVQIASNRAEYEAALGQTTFDLILSDYKLPDYDGMAALALAHEKYPKIPFIMISGTLGEEEAVDCVLHGATDFVLKQHLYRLVPAVMRALIETQEHQKRLKTTKALRESEALHRHLMAKLPVGVIIVDALTRNIESVNAWAAALYGGAAEQIVGQRCHSFLCPAQEKKCPVLDLDQKVDHSEKILIQVDGSRLPILKSVTRIHVGGQEKLLECFVDITDRKQAEAEALKSQERHRIILQTAMDGFWTADMQGRLLEVNDTYCSMIGYSLHELLAMRITDLEVGETPNDIAAHSLTIKTRGEHRATNSRGSHGRCRKPAALGNSRRA